MLIFNGERHWLAGLGPDVQRFTGLTILAITTLLSLTSCASTPPLTFAPTEAYAPTDSECQAFAEQAGAMPIIAPGNGGTATQWKAHQLLLTSSQEYANPYTDVAISATFNGPSGKQLTMQGFWNGDNNYAVRFTPVAAGDWTYSITSVPADSGLTQSGSFTAVAAGSADKGFLRRDPENPYSFIYDNGERYFKMGQTYYDIIRTACATDAWKEGVLMSQQYGINKIRLFVHSLGFGPDHKHPSFHPPVYAFVDDNHDQLNLAYWNKLDEVVIYLANQGMVADLILFMKPIVTDDELAFGTQVQDERYVRYILARYAAFPNVIWCLSNEWEYTGRNEEYWDTMGEIVHSEDPWMTQHGVKRLLSIHNAPGDFSFFDSSWPVHAIVQLAVHQKRFQNGDEWGNHSIVGNHGHDIPVVNDEYGYIGDAGSVDLTREQHRNALWGIAVGGGYSSAGDARIFNEGPNGEPGRVIMTGHWHEAEEYGDIKRMVDFWTTQDIPYWKMLPQNSLIAEGKRVYALADEEGEYVIYSAAGGEFSVTLPEGTYRVRQYDPRSGTTTPLSDVRGGATVRLELPDSRDWVLHLSRKAF